MSIEVHIDWRGQTLLVGRLYPADRGAAVSFQYDRGWLARADVFSIDPTGLPRQSEPQHAGSLFGAIQDCGPDRWGRVLIERAMRKHVLATRPYRDLDYVLALDDFSRIGALRFREPAGGNFLQQGDGRLPPVMRLATLVAAADAIHHETETAADLRFLLGVGSPLGGARPKSAVLLTDGSLGIAKFPKPDDTRDIAAGEVLALTLARTAGITTAGHQLVDAGGRNVAVITRFDRAGPQRIPFISAATLLGLTPGAAGAYTQLAEGIRQHGHDHAGDLRELWRRMIFSLLCGNFDDHMRNHGFLMRSPGQWALSPAYDLNPVPAIDRAGLPQTAIAEDQAAPSIEGALAAAPRFGLSLPAARQVVREVETAVNRWREVGRGLRLKRGTLDAYASAFENEHRQAAQTIPGETVAVAPLARPAAANRVARRSASRPRTGFSP